MTCGTCPEYDPAGTRIAIVKLAAAGDVLRTTSFLPSLVRRHEGARIRWLTLAPTAPLLEGLPELWTVDRTSGEALPVGLSMTPQDLVICPDADLGSVALAMGIPLRPGGRRLGFILDGDGEVRPLGEAAERWFAMGLSDRLKKANDRTYQDLVGAIFELPTPIEDRPGLVLRPSERAAAETWFADAAGGIEAKGLIGLNTGAGGRWPQKRWTLDGQCTLIEKLCARGYRVLLLGGPDEGERHRKLKARIADGPGHRLCLDAGTDNSLRDFAARLSLCDALVTGDTLALHLATALGIPVVALFGPTSHAEIELYGRGTKLYAADLDCLGCYSACDRDPDCQESIPPERVLEALEPFLPS